MDDNENGAGMIAAIEELVERGGAKVMVAEAPDGTMRTYLMHHHNMTAKEVPPINPTLAENIRQHVSVYDQQSFVDYVDRYKSVPGAHPVIFLDPVSASMTGELDYHGSAGLPAHRGHRVRWDMQLSEEWKAWNSIDGKYLSQREFADFIEENIKDIRSPPGADMLTVVTHLNMSKKVSFESGIRLADGQTQFRYHEENEAKTKGDIIIPTEITLGIPVLFGAPVADMVKGYFRYRIADGKIAFRVSLQQKANILSAAIREAGEQVAQATSVEMFLGDAGG